MTLALKPRISLHRDLRAAELYISQLVNRQPPASLNLRTGLRHSEPPSQLGPTMSATLLRYLGHPEGYGLLFPWSRALYRLRAECRRNHAAAHRAPEYDGALCQHLVRATVIERHVPRGPSALLRVALEFIEAEVTITLLEAERLTREEAGHFEVGEGRSLIHHVVPGLHLADCPQCRRQRGIRV